MQKLHQWLQQWWHDIGSPRGRRTLLLILLVGGVARVAWVAHAGVEPRFAGDPRAYLLQGETLARGHGYSNPLIEIENVLRRREHKPLLARQPASFYPPGYPVFVAAVVWTVWHTPIPDGDLVRAIGYVQALLGVITILLVFELARRAFDRRVALVAAAIVAIYPNLITTTATLQLETVFVALSLAALILLLPVATDENPRVGRLVFGGAVIGVVALVRPTIGLVLFAIVATRWLARRPWRETLVVLATVVVAMVAALVPWMVRNAVELHAFVPISTGIGPTLCMSRNPEANGALDIAVLARECQPKRLTGSAATYDAQVNRYGTGQAIHWVVHHPASEVRMWFTRTRIAYRHDTSGLDDYRAFMSPRSSRVATDVSDAVSFGVLGLAFLGAVVAASRKRPAAVFLLGSAIAFAAVPAILFGEPRYRVPAEPLFVIFAAVGICAMVDAARRRGLDRTASLTPAG